jgi:hypothetical protein
LIAQQELIAQEALHRRPAIIGAVEIADAKTPIEVIGLHRIGLALEAKHELIELRRIGDVVVREWKVRVRRRTRLESGIEPPVRA